jgi:hypothetical protein
LGRFTVSNRATNIGGNLMVECDWLASVNFREIHRTNLNSIIIRTLTVESSSEIMVT